MAWRPTPFVEAGELDNTIQGWTTGWLHLNGIADRVTLKLAGNCHPDLAGWNFQIKRTEPEPEELNEVLDDDDEAPDYTGLRLQQLGHVGDITADQMIKHFDLPDREVTARLMAGEQLPFTWRKCLYIEWFSNTNGRVVIQSTRLEVKRIGERVFELTEEAWQEQARQNQNEMQYFMTQLGDAVSKSSPDDPNHDKQDE